MPPFQAERPEKTKPIRCHGGPQSRQPFCEEGEERDVEQGVTKKRKAPAKPFGNEESSEDEIEPAHKKESSTVVCSLGWDTLAAFAKSTAWARQSVDYQAAQSGKRHYDNSKRSMAAKAKPSSQSIPENGRDLVRISNLLTADCECALD